MCITTLDYYKAHILFQECHEMKARQSPQNLARDDNAFGKNAPRKFHWDTGLEIVAYLLDEVTNTGIR